MECEFRTLLKKKLYVVVTYYSVRDIKHRKDIY